VTRPTAPMMRTMTARSHHWLHPHGHSVDDGAGHKILVYVDRRL